MKRNPNRTKNHRLMARYYRLMARHERRIGRFDMAVFWEQFVEYLTSPPGRCCVVAHIEEGVGSCLASATKTTQPKEPTMTTATAITATYAKLHNGSWGIRVKGVVTAGDTVTVTKRDGTTKTETVGRVLFCKDGLSICSLEQASSSSRGGRRGSRGARRECDECGEYATPGTVCWETGCTH